MKILDRNKIAKQLIIFSVLGLSSGLNFDEGIILFRVMSIFMERIRDTNNSIESDQKLLISILDEELVKI
jgi:hypothetical protein